MKFMKKFILSIFSFVVLVSLVSPTAQATLDLGVGSMFISNLAPYSGSSGMCFYSIKDQDGNGVYDYQINNLGALRIHDVTQLSGLSGRYHTDMGCQQNAF